ncbi:TetR/AcrR family transcriptional regulator [Maricaulis sp. CAU 1757]
MRNSQRSEQTIGRLVSAARSLFAAHGYAGTGTEAVLELAGVKRGAMYHHFRDKAALFERVCHDVSEEAAEAIRQAVGPQTDGMEALVTGSQAWVGAMIRPDASRIVLVDSPTVLGPQGAAQIDRETGGRLLQEGLEAALASGAIRFDGQPDLLFAMVNGALNGLALSLAMAPQPDAAWQQAVRGLFERFAAV